MLAAATVLAMASLQGCAMTGAARASSAAAPVTTLSIGTPVQGQLAPDAVLRWRVDVPAGSVVRGTIDATGLQLDVQDAQGRHVRRLLRSDAVGEGFTWLAQLGEYLVLHVSDQAQTPYADAKTIAGSDRPSGASPQNGQYRIVLERSWGPGADQSVTLPSKPLQSPRLQALVQQLAAGGNTDTFWRDMAAQGTPMVEPWSETERLVTFVWRGAQHSVRLFGSPSGNHESLQPLVAVSGQKTDVWWASFVMPRDVRLSYALAPDVPQIDGTAMEQRRSIIATLQRDPLNPRTWGAGAVGKPGEAPVDAYQGRSVLQLPDAPPQPWLAKRAGVIKGDLQRHWLVSEPLGNGRDVWVYRPAGWQQVPADQRALLVLFDAHAYLRDVPTPQIVDNLVADGLIPHTAVVLVANASSELRGIELPPNPQFADFMGQQLMPWLTAQGINVPAARTVIAGSSYGGLASSYVALQYPQHFGNVLSLSGSYWWAPKGEAPNAMARWWAAASEQPVSFYLDAGLYESARGGQAGILETSRELGDVLRSKGYRVIQLEHSTGHDYVHWQGSIACGLVALLNPGARITRQPACKGR
ncbi:MAG: DUF3327 domain-containing protein [Comamonas sp.]